MDLLAWLLLCPPAVATLVLATELAAAQFAPRALPGGGTPRLAVIVPAHDEAEGIAATLAALLGALPTDARLIVIADNCTDDTADRARAAGADVIERHDPNRRGKGFALAHARDHLATDPPEVVVVVDADCTIEGDGIVHLAASADALDRPVQSAYLLRPRPEMGALVGLSGFAFLIRNLVRQRGLARLGAPALLTGSGMAFPWAAFLAAPLATDDLVEDLAIGIALTQGGRAPAFLPSVRTWSDPARRSATAVQRRRWEQGFLRTAFAAAPLLLRGGPNWLGLHLLVPPLALLALVDLAATGLLFGLTGLGASALPARVLAGLLFLVVLLLLLAWARFGREQIAGRRLLLIPFYIAWKLPLYLMTAIRPERRWIRTDRR